MDGNKRLDSHEMAGDRIILSALGLCEMVLDKEHPFTLTSTNNLASVLRDQGKCE